MNSTTEIPQIAVVLFWAIPLGSAFLCGWMSYAREGRYFAAAVVGALLAIIALPTNFYLNMRSEKPGTKAPALVAALFFLSMIPTLVIVGMMSTVGCSTPEVDKEVRRLMREQLAIAIKDSDSFVVADKSTGSGIECVGLYDDAHVVSGKSMVTYSVYPSTSGSGQFIINVRRN